MTTLHDDIKTKDELIDELKKLRRKIACLESRKPDSIDRSHVGPEYLVTDCAKNDRDFVTQFPVTENSTETIDLSSLFTKDVTISGSFEIKNRIWKTTFGKVLQALPIPTLLIDQSFKITAANEAWKRLISNYEELIGCAFSSLFSEEYEIKVPEMAHDVFVDRKPRIGEAALTIGKHALWARLSFRSIRILNERFLLVLVENLTTEKKQLALNRMQKQALEREITDRQVSERAARESEARFRQIYDSAPMMMQAVDRSGIVRSVNQKWLAVVGYTAPEILGSHIKHIMSETCRIHLDSMLENLWKTGVGHDLNCQFVKKDGSLIDVLVDAAVIDDPVWGTVSLSAVRDVSHEIILEKQLREAQKMEALGTLAGGIAHDFNNLLQIILGFSDLLLMNKDYHGSQSKALQSIRDAARRGSELVNQILTFSSKVATNPTLIDLNQIVKKVEHLLSRTISKMIKIELIEECDLMPVFADPGQMEQVLINLAVNAKDAMPQGGQLTIETKNLTLTEQFCKSRPEVQPGDYVLLRVSDSGHGISEEIIGRIFEPFFTTKKPGEGTGLGLSTVFGIIKMHRGHISCNSIQATGTTFDVYLPAMRTGIGSEVDMTSEMPAFGSETILVVDDEELIRNLGADVLSSIGYTVLTACDGEEALDIYRQEHSRISLVILDLVMPKMGGKQCLEELVKIDPHSRVLIASGYMIDEETRSVLDQKARGIIKKPFNAKELLRNVRSVMDKP